MSTLHAQLKRETNDIHQQIHQLPRMRQLLSSQVQVADVHSLLHIFYDFHLAYSSFFVIAERQAFAERADCLAWLQKDLGITGDDGPASLAKGKPNRADEHFKARHEITPDFDSYVGFLYVTQGSTLGGQHINRHLIKVLGAKNWHGSRFFYAYGEQTQAMWLRFLNFLSLNEAQLSPTRVISTANTFFNILHERLLEESYR